MKFINSAYAFVLFAACGQLEKEIPNLTTQSKTVTTVTTTDPVVVSGKDGTNGTDGKNGVDGKDGISCSQFPIAATNIADDIAEFGGTNIICPNSSVFISNGATGEKGETGTTGIQGIQGVAGEKGDIGVQGIQGIQGETGTVGETGSQGIQGEIGATGAAGEKGDTGATGAQGIQGVQGSKGDSGKDGKDAVSIITIQFCPGFIQSYPSVFAESGVCIDNKMFGVYSANGGFLAELPPGAYSSNGINASCTFKIEENCKVSY